MWVETLENRWLQDVQITNDGDRLKFSQYESFSEYKTLIFKDPVKFFGTLKVMDLVDDGIIALTSKMDGEVVGYLVDDGEFRLRIPLSDQNKPKSVTGLNFLPQTVHDEMCSTAALIKHIQWHEIVDQIDVNYHLLCNLHNALSNAIDEASAAEIRLQIDAAEAERRRLRQNRNFNCDLNLIEILEERIDKDTVHFHEIYEEHFDFCTRYYSSKLGEHGSPDVINRIAKLMFSRCSYERRDPKNICSLKIVDPIGLRSVYSVETKSTLDIEIV
jgi:hypothetical protein